MLTSQVLRESDWRKPWFIYACNLLDIPLNVYHRKYWELAYITFIAVFDRKPGMEMLGFGVGQEILPSAFEDLGFIVTATDMPADLDSAGAWTQTGQHNPNVMPVDMNNIPERLHGRFDFVWSTSCMEHLGSISKGLAFWENMKKCLKPGGIAVHVTEYNITSQTHTLTHGPTVLFRDCDLQRMVPDVDLRLEDGPHETRLPKPDPDGFYREDHLRLPLGGYVLTSVGLIYRNRG